MRGRALVAVAVAVVCGLVVAFGSGLAATGRKQRGSSACKIVSAPVLRPRLSPSAPPVALSSILEVLRRPRSGAAELPPGGAPLVGYSVLWVNYIHLLATGPDQTRYFLIPGIIDTHPSAACLRSLSPSERDEYKIRLHTASVTLEVVRDEKVGAIPYTAHAIEAGDILLAVPGQSNLTAIVSGVVPDGVASETITATNGATITAPVVNNLLVAELPVSELKSMTVKWYAADGSLVKVIQAGRARGLMLITTGGPTEIEISPPPSVVRSGKQQVAEFEQGRRVVAQSGCLACHRIGQAGNRGPGPDLTHIGSTLSARGIEHAIVDPTAPMPSFKNLPTAKFKALVAFLSELR